MLVPIVLLVGFSVHCPYKIPTQSTPQYIWQVGSKASNPSHQESRRGFFWKFGMSSATLITPISSYATPATPSEEAVGTLVAARDTLDFLLSNWEKTVIDCSTADVSRDLLESQNKEQLLEKAKTFALFDKDAAVLSCKESNGKVRQFINRLKRLDGQFASAKFAVMEKDRDIERYFELVDTYNSALSAANSASYTASMDFSSLNANKMDTTVNREDQQLAGGSDNMNNTREELRRALLAINEITQLLQ
mmetsp:Transcript_13652/g.27922  ORF Transcript_13652/g.27922 Transcript_13652/m.27922 type:complete len:249 (-) Transcript_13652:3-749(-)